VDSILLLLCNPPGSVCAVIMKHTEHINCHQMLAAIVVKTHQKLHSTTVLRGIQSVSQQREADTLQDAASWICLRVHMHACMHV
jgi:hypothetical protein